MTELPGAGVVGLTLMSTPDGGGEEPPPEPPVTVNWTLTVTLEEVPFVTVNHAVYDPAPRFDAKLTVTVPWSAPLVGETVTQEAVGAEIDQFRDRLPPLALIDTVFEGGVVPCAAWELTDVGVTVSLLCWAYADADNISEATTTPDRTRTERLIIKASSIELMTQGTSIPVRTSHARWSRRSKPHESVTARRLRTERTVLPGTKEIQPETIN